MHPRTREVDQGRVVTRLMDMINFAIRYAPGMETSDIRYWRGWKIANREGVIRLIKLHYAPEISE
jgi:hypothetical protein